MTKQRQALNKHRVQTLMKTLITNDRVIEVMKTGDYTKATIAFKDEVKKVDDPFTRKYMNSDAGWAAFNLVFATRNSSSTKRLKMMCKVLYAEIKKYGIKETIKTELMGFRVFVKEIYQSIRNEMKGRKESE